MRKVIFLLGLLVLMVSTLVGGLPNTQACADYAAYATGHHPGMGSDTSTLYAMRDACMSSGGGNSSSAVATSGCDPRYSYDEGEHGRCTFHSPAHFQKWMRDNAPAHKKWLQKNEGGNQKSKATNFLNGKL